MLSNAYLRWSSSQHRIVDYVGPYGERFAFVLPSVGGIGAYGYSANKKAEEAEVRATAANKQAVEADKKAEEARVRAVTRKSKRLPPNKLS